MIAGAERVAAWMRNDPQRWELLGHVAALDLPDCWIAAGFVRNAVWRILHGMPATITGDVDVIWFDPDDIDEARDRELEALLHARAPGVDWSVSNQARMHLGNGDAPYVSTEDAMRFWPETATAVAVRRCGDACELIAPFGLDDLLGLVLRPAGDFVAGKRAIFDARRQAKRWLTDFPGLTVAQ